MASSPAKIQDTILILSDSIDDFIEDAERLLNTDNVNILEILYLLGMKVNEFKEEDTEPLVKTIAENLKQLPVYYHTQLLRGFINRYYGEKFDNTDTAPLDATSLAIRDLLMKETDEYINITKLIPSPLEVIYLFLNGVINKQTGVTNSEYTNLTAILNNEPAQKRALLDYLDKFDSAYSEDLQQGILKHAK